jgi:hypothetical protein
MKTNHESILGRFRGDGIRDKERGIPRLVVVDGIPEDWAKDYPFKNGECVFFLGEIVNMGGHVIVATKDGKVHCGFHEEYFRNATEDEI